MAVDAQRHVGEPWDHQRARTVEAQRDADAAVSADAFDSTIEPGT